MPAGWARRVGPWIHNERDLLDWSRRGGLLWRLDEHVAVRSESAYRLILHGDIIAVVKVDKADEVVKAEDA